MTKRGRRIIASALVDVIHYVSQAHIAIHKLLDRWQADNIAAWKKIILWLVIIYAKLLPLNGVSDESE